MHKRFLYFGISVFTIIVSYTIYAVYNKTEKIIEIHSPFEDAMLLYWDTGKNLCIDGNEAFPHAENKFQICSHSKKAMMLFEINVKDRNYINVYVYSNIEDVFDSYAGMTKDENESDGDKYFQRFSKNDIIAYVKTKKDSVPTQKIRCYGDCTFAWND